MGAIFISHSSRDNAAASDVCAELEEQGHRSVFLDFDPANGIPAGRNWEKELYMRLRSCRAVIVLCSEHSMKSDWCFAEITHAKSLGKHIFPIKVAPCSLRSVLTDLQVIDLTSDRARAYQRLEQGLLSAGLDPRNAFDWDGSRSPYPGLLAFQESDAAIFFGRDAEIQHGLDVLNRLHHFGGSRFFLILGASGSGKSSLVRAGLVPRLKRDMDRWLVVDPFRPLHHPMRELALVLNEAFMRYETPRDRQALQNALELATANTESDSRGLNDLAEELRLAAGRRDATVLLVIDQVEELLGYAPEDNASRFLSFLRAAVDVPNSQIMVLGTLRSDFLGHFQGKPALREMPFESFPVGPFSANGFAQVIEGPAEVAGVELETGLVQAMVNDTETHDALPLLAFTLRELYQRYGADGRLTVKEYQELGGLEGSVARAAEAVMAAQPISREEQDDLHSAFVSMVRINEEGQYARRPARWGDLPQRSHVLLERFVAARLLVSSSDDQGRLLEVAHEALFRAWNQLKRWLDEDLDRIHLRDGIQQAAKEWDAGGREPQFLVHRQARLEAAEALACQPRFERDVLARDYVQACVDVRESEREVEQRRELEKRRRQRNVRLIITTVLIVGSILALLWRQQAQEAEKNQDLVVAQKLAIESQAQLGSTGEGLVRSTLLSLASLNSSLTPPGVLGWVETMNLLPRTVATLPHEDRVLDLSFNKDGQRLIARTPTALTLFDIDTGRVTRRPHKWPVSHQDGLVVWVLDKGNKLLATAESNVAHKWDTDSLESEFSAKLDAEVLSVALTPDGRWLAAGTASPHEVIVWNENGVVVGQAKMSDKLKTLSFSPDSKWLVAATMADLRVWQLEPWKEVLAESSFGGHMAFSENWLVTGAGHAFRLGEWKKVEGLYPYPTNRRPTVSPTGQWFALQGPLIKAVWSNDMIQNNNLNQEWEIKHTFDSGNILAFTHHNEDAWVVHATDKKVEIRGMHETETHYLEHPGVTSVASSARNFATASKDGTIRIWNMDWWKEDSRLPHGGPVDAIAFSLDGERLATVGPKSSIQIWEVKSTLDDDFPKSTTEMKAEACSRLNVTSQAWKDHFADLPHAEVCGPP